MGITCTPYLESGGSRERFAFCVRMMSRRRLVRGGATKIASNFKCGTLCRFTMQFTGDERGMH